MSVDVFGPREPHRCAWGRACGNAEVTADVDPETGRPIRKGAPIIDGPLCVGCLTRLTYAVKGMPRDYVRLAVAIGEKRSTDAAKVAMSTELPVNINVHREMLQAFIVEIADRAAEVLEVELGMTGKARHRDDTPREFEKDGVQRRADPTAGFRAKGASTTGSTAITVDNAARLLLSSLDALLDSEPQPHMLWLPLPDSKEECDKYPHGQPREVVELSGLDIAYRIVRLSSDVFAELGRNKLRHHFAGPCPAWVSRERRYCGAETVGRDDGSSVVDCETCGATWEEKDYWFIEGLVLDEIEEREEHDLLKYLLAEAYWRLDTLRKRGDAATNDEVVQQLIGGEPVAQEVFSGLIGVLDIGPEPHTTPAGREIAAKEHEKTKQDKAKQRRKEAIQR